MSYNSDETASPTLPGNPPKGKFLLFGACGAVVGAAILAIILFATGVFVPVSSATAQSPGFATPEDAAKAYLNGLRNLDIDAMVSTFAVENYVEHYDFEAELNYLRAYSSGIEIKLPNTTEHTRQVNIADRRIQLLDAICTQYFCFNTPDMLNEYPPPIALDDPAVLSDFLKKLESGVKNYVFDDLVITGVMQPEDIDDLYLSEMSQESIERQAKLFGANADDVDTPVITFNADGTTWLFCPQAVRYNNRWYLESLHGNLIRLIGVPSYTGGIVPTDMPGF